MLAVAGYHNIQSDLIPRLATGFCAGMARTGRTCGAVSGGIMAIGLSLGRSSPDESNDPCYPAVQAFLNGFITQFGSLSCQDLTGVNLGTPEGQAAFWASDQITRCTDYVTHATRLVVEIVDQYLPRSSP